MDIQKKVLAAVGFLIVVVSAAFFEQWNETLSMAYVNSTEKIEGVVRFVCVTIFLIGTVAAIMRMTQNSKLAGVLVGTPVFAVLYWIGVPAVTWMIVGDSTLGEAVWGKTFGRAEFFALAFTSLMFVSAGVFLWAYAFGKKPTP